jgi:hypothetical protein
MRPHPLHDGFDSSAGSPFTAETASTIEAPVFRRRFEGGLTPDTCTSELVELVPGCMELLSSSPGSAFTSPAEATISSKMLISNAAMVGSPLRERTEQNTKTRSHRFSDSGPQRGGYKRRVNSDSLHS